MITPSPPPVVAYSLDVSFLPDAFATYGANGTLLESGVAQKSNTKHATGIVARVVVGQALFDDIEAKVAALREQFARHDAFDKDALATAAAKRAWKCQQRVIRREMYLNRHMLTAMAKYIGSVPLPTYRAEGDDDDGRGVCGLFRRHGFGVAQRTIHGHGRGRRRGHRRRDPGSGGMTCDEANKLAQEIVAAKNVKLSRPPARSRRGSRA
jgi:hypothetical protein